MNFIKVTASRCNKQGYISAQTTPCELHLNCDLIEAIYGDEVLLNGVDVINLGGDYYTRFRLAPNEKISSKILTTDHYVD